MRIPVFKGIRLGVVAVGAMWLQIADASATKIVDVFGDKFNLNIINNFYNTLPDVSSSIISHPLDTANLTGVNLLWAVQPAATYTAAELTTMSNYLATGGRIAFMGEHGFFAPNENNRITAAVAALGGHMSIVNDIQDSGFHDATVSNGQILTNALTAGVNTYNYAAFADLVLGGTAQTLMLGTNLTSIMMGYENVGAGSIFLITDQNVWDNVNASSNDNKVLFANLLSAETGAPPVSMPEPASVLVLGLGVLALGSARRFRQFRS